MKDPKDFESIHDLPLIFHDVMDANEITLDALKEMTREEIVEMQVMWKLGTTQWYETFKYWLHKAGLKIVEQSHEPSIFEIYFKAKSIVGQTEISWEEKYDLIFSEEISQKVPFTWYDPDMDYQQDVMAFVRAFDEYMKNNQ